MDKRVRKIAKKVASIAQLSRKNDGIERYRSDIHVINKPFYFEGTNRIGVLLVHGWSSTPYEMRALGEYLHNLGYTVYAPLLTGHGTVPENLEDVTWQVWRNDVENAYNNISERCDYVYIGGMSLGGSLALHIAQKYTNVAGLILMSTPFNMRYERLGYHASQIVRHFRTYKTKFYPRILGRSLCMTQLISYQRYPIESAYEAFYGIKAATQQLHRITQPCMIIQSKHDHMVNGKSCDDLVNAMHARSVEKIFLKNAYHNFIGDTENKHVFDDIYMFIKRNTART